MDCKNCGGELKKVGSKYVCKCCGSEFEESAFAPSAPTVNAPSYNPAPRGGNVNNGKLSGEEIYDKLIPSSVEIYVENQKSAAAASGFFVSSQGFVVTNAHAVVDYTGKLFDSIYVKIKSEYYPALPVALGAPWGSKNNSVDLCLLYVPDLDSRSKAVELGSMDNVRNGQTVYLIGNSLGAGTCITSGIISDRSREITGVKHPIIVTDAAANHGNSGGPLVDSTGKVIGVLVAGIDGAKGMNYAIPVNVLDDFLTYVIKEARLDASKMGELSSYAMSTSRYAMDFAMAISGVKLIADVISYIVQLFRKK